MTVFWPGKKLDAEEESWLRNRILSLIVDGSVLSLEEAGSLERYLPENYSNWTPDELEGGAHIGPWITLEGAVDGA